MSNEHTSRIIESEQIKKSLLEDAEKKPVQGFRQIDYFNYSTGALEHDGEFDLFSGAILELRRSDCMRLQIPEGYSLQDVLQGLEKITEWIKSDPELVNRLPEAIDEETRRLQRSAEQEPIDYDSPF